MTPDLEARRARAVHRAMARYVSSPSPEALALIDWLTTAGSEVFDTGLIEVHGEVGAHGFEDYVVDGVAAGSRASAVVTVQDRYGVTRAEAEQLVPHVAQQTDRPVRPLGSVR